MEIKFTEFKPSKQQVNVIFDCLIGPCSCPPDCSDLFNYVHQLTSCNAIIVKEVRIFKSFGLRGANKTLFRASVSFPDTFSFEKCIDLFCSIYGSDIIIEFLVL